MFGYYYRGPFYLNLYADGDAGPCCERRATCDKLAATDPGRRVAVLHVTTKESWLRRPRAAP